MLIEAEKQEDPKKFSMNFYKIYSFLKNILISGKLHDRMSLVFVAIIAIAFLGESFTWQKIIGIAMMFAGAILISLF